MNGVGIKISCTNSLISDNIVRDVAPNLVSIGLRGTTEDNMAVGIRVTGEPGNNTISWNRVYNTGYTGIQFYKNNTLVEYNYIDHAMCIRTDNGGIYTSWYNKTSEYGPHGSQVRNNIVVNTLGMKDGFTSARDFVMGIYIDESGENVDVYNNVIVNSNSGGVKLHKNRGSKVYNNLIFGADHYIEERSSQTGTVNEIYNNLVVLSQQGAKDGYYDYSTFYLYTGTKNSTVNNNTYITPYQTTNLFHYEAGESTVTRSFSQWQATGNDQNSTMITTPLSAGESYQVVYNDTKQEKTFTITGTGVVKMPEATTVSSITLQPFTGAVIKGTNININ